MVIHYSSPLNIEHERQRGIVKDNSKVTIDRIVMVILEIW